jgi:uncharacterized protein YjbI with pentapeptide repeats
MADPLHLELVHQGVEVWNKWRSENPGVTPDLTRANLRFVSLSKANFSGTNFLDADLSRTDISQADLTLADLREANLFRSAMWQTNFTRADLRGANFTMTDLRRADLHLADLSLANLTGADLSGADLNHAIFFGTVFGHSNLTNAVGLDTCTHHGSSILDYSTFARSAPLPVAFLRGCGLPEGYIKYLSSTVTTAIQFHSCFISYSTQDQDFAEHLYADLQDKGVRCWFAPHDIRSGKKLHEQIDAAIQLQDRLLLILSKASMESAWVETEIAKARRREFRENRRMLFPVRLIDFETLRKWECFDSDTGKDSAREIREYYVPDFSNWRDHDSYQREFARLLRDLKAEQKRDAAQA